MNTLTRLAILGSLILAPAATLAADFEGKPKVDSGETIFLSKEKLRLYGINAPSKRQFCPDDNGGVFACGDLAQKHMKKLLKGAEVACDIVERGNDDKLARVSCARDGDDIALEMVQAGFAQAIAGEVDAYEEAQQAAYDAGEGLWSYSYVDFEVVKDPKSARKSGCDIKGNISASGRVYHDTKSRWYKRTGIEVEFGERWFCSARAARSAGWRAPG